MTSTVIYPDISKLINLHPEAYSHYMAAKAFTLKYFYDMMYDENGWYVNLMDEEKYGVYGFATHEIGYYPPPPALPPDPLPEGPVIPPQFYYDEYEQWFLTYETNMHNSLELDRRVHLRDYFLVANGYKEFYAGSYSTKMEPYTMKHIVTLNDITQQLEVMPTNHYLSNYATMPTIIGIPVPGACLTQETDIAKIYQSTMSNEIINEACARVMARSPEFFNTFLGAKGFIS